MIAELAPIITLIFLSALSFGTAAVLSIRSKKSVLETTEYDFIDNAIAKKKKSLKTNFAVLTWKQYKLLMLVMPLLFGAISYVCLSTKTMCIIFAVIGLFIPELIVKIGIQQKKKKFDEQYAMALRTLSSSLRAGKSIIQSIDSVITSPFIEESIKLNFRQISSDIKVGITLENAFLKFAQKTNSMDAFDVASALSMQAKVGGSESNVINAISQKINERIMMRKEIKMIFAETEVLINVLEIFPWAVIAIFSIFAPQFILPFFASRDMTILFVLIMLFTIVGSVFIRRMVRSAKYGGK